MVTDQDSVIGNVAEVSILENIMTDENGGVKKFERFLGKESLMPSYLEQCRISEFIFNLC